MGQLQHKDANRILLGAVSGSTMAISAGTSNLWRFANRLTDSPELHETRAMVGNGRVIHCMIDPHIISFGLVDGRPVFMDERTDSYFMIEAAHEGRLQSLLDGGEPLACDDLLDAVGITDRLGAIVHASAPRPAQAILDLCSPKPARLMDIVGVAHVVCSTRSQLRTRPIEDLLRLEPTGLQRGSTHARHQEDLQRKAQSFLAARKLVPIANNCLLDSLSLLRWLGPLRTSVALIFGVKLDPFAAHCWVQTGDLLINDRVETVSAFTPVRVIECLEAMR